MKNPLGSTLWWAELAVGSRWKLFLLTALQVAASLYMSMITEWRVVILTALFGVLVPKLFMHALRQALLESKQIRKECERAKA